MLEDVYEPYLVKNNFINRTPKGRVATEFAAIVNASAILVTK